MNNNPFIPPPNSAQPSSHSTMVSAFVLKFRFQAQINLYGTPTLSVASFAISTRRSRVLYTS